MPVWNDDKLLAPLALQQRKAVITGSLERTRARLTGEIFAHGDIDILAFVR